MTHSISSTPATTDEVERDDAALVERLTYLIHFYIYDQADEKDVRSVIESLAERDSWTPRDGWIIVGEGHYYELRDAALASTPAKDEVERVARAIAATTGSGDPDEIGNRTKQPRWMIYVSQAKAAIAALASTPAKDEVERRIADALSDLKFGMDFAYEQGLHEFGYDPLEVVTAALASTPAKDEVERQRDEAWAAMRWVYQNGMVPHPTRPEWVSNAFHAAHEPLHDAALNQGAGK